ncbi:PfkB family carbohydrate kinase [Arthrobacter sp. LjRoot14]|uniref:PfkB family carbohydrate kinase n=1 Tax=Arthrobacter sp. LjRoot14 TaxID=3342265 RepID=UPI003ECD8EE0
MTAHPDDYPAASAPDVLVVGESLVDIVSTTNGTTEHPGGSPANVAYGLGCLGVDTTLLTSIGGDRRGVVVENHLARAGVRVLPGSRHPGRTATATATLTAEGSARYDFDIRWELPTAAPIVLPRIIHTGSIATFLAPGATAVRALLEQSRPECMITYDPNIRPELLGTQAEARSMFEDLVPLTNVIKLSNEDAMWLYPGHSFDDVASRILKLGAEMVAMTLGPGGSLLATRTAKLFIPAIKCVVEDTIGAGDSYMAALIYGLLTGGTDGLAPSQLTTIGHTAAMAAAITVGRAGASPPTAEELDAALTTHASSAGIAGMALPFAAGDGAPNGA